MSSACCLRLITAMSRAEMLHLRHFVDLCEITVRMSLYFCPDLRAISRLMTLATSLSSLKLQRVKLSCVCVCRMAEFESFQRLLRAL